MRKERMKSYVFMIFGIAIVAMAISLFLVPNKIVNGGASGLARHDCTLYIHHIH